MAPEIARNARRLTIYIGESDRWQGKPLYAALLEALKKEGVAGATVTRGVAGFGAHSRIHTAAILRLSEDLPLRIEVIDSPEKIDHTVDLVAPMVREGLITVDDVQVVKYTHRYLNPLPSDRPVAEVMTREVVTIHPEMGIAQAWERMLEHQLKALPVVTRDGTVVGMLTDEDLLSRAGLSQRLSVAERLDADTVSRELAALADSPINVADVMTKPAITAKVTEPLGAAALRMAKHGIKRLPIVDESNRLAGVLSRRDVLNQVVVAETRVRRVDTPPGAARTVQEVMSTEIPSVRLDSSLPEVIAALIENNTHRLIVVDAQGCVVGIISDADVVARVSPAERHGVLKALRKISLAPAGEVTAGDLMSPGVLTANVDNSVPEAIKKMLAEGRKWLVVVDSEGRPLGLIDRQILLRAVLHS